LAGTACTFATCNGINDLACVLKCFNNDILRALNAASAAQCVYGRCTAECLGPVPVEPNPLLDMAQE
jgi:hypothetical protein